MFLYIGYIYILVSGRMDLLFTTVKSPFCHLCCSATLLFLLLQVNWPLWGELTIGCLSLLDSAVLFIAASTKLLWLAYICHILYRTTYAFLITIARSHCTTV